MFLVVGYISSDIVLKKGKYAAWNLRQREKWHQKVRVWVLLPTPWMCDLCDVIHPFECCLAFPIETILSTSQIIYVCWDRVMSGWPWTCYAAADDPELCPLSVCWGYRHVPPCPVYIVLRTESRFTAWSSGMLGKHSTNPPTSPAFHWVFIRLQMCVYVSVYKINCHSKFYNKDFHA